MQCYLQASQPFGRHPYCSMWWRRNLYSDQREGPSLTWGPRWDQQTRRVAPAHLHTNPLGFFRQTPDEEQRNSRVYEFIKHNIEHDIFSSMILQHQPDSHPIKKKTKNKNSKETLIYLPLFQSLAVFLWTHPQVEDLHTFSALWWHPGCTLSAPKEPEKRMKTKH